MELFLSKTAWGFTYTISQPYMLCNEKLNIKAYYNKGTCNNVLFIGTHTMNKQQNEQINIALIMR